MIFDRLNPNADPKTSRAVFTGNRLLLACILLALSGCASEQPRQPRPGASANTLPPSGAQRVEMINLFTRTPAFDGSAVNADPFLGMLRGLRGEPPARLRHLVATYPDVSLEMLRNPPPAASAEELSSLARAFDTVYCGTFVDGWSAVYAATASAQTGAAASGDAAYRQRRARILSLIEQGRFDAAAAEQRSIEPAMHPFLHAECLRLCGVAQLLDGHAAQAAACWKSARELAAADANTSAELGLLITDSVRRMGDADAWRSAWNQAVTASVLIHDPALWQRAIELQPPGAAWPAAVRTSLVSAAHATTAQPPTTDEIWLQIADWRLARAEGSLALLAYTQAESQSATTAITGQARIGQARALLLMNQPGPASSILTSVAASPQAILANRAIAILGVMRLEQGEIQDGLRLLQKSVETNPDLLWPGVTQAQADLGLAYLSAGDEAKGLQWLHRAQARFRSDGDVPQLAQCLANEALYFESTGRPDEGKIVRQQAALAWNDDKN